MFFLTRIVCIGILSIALSVCAVNLQLTQATPSGDLQEMSEAGAVQITFNQPMVSLGKLPEGNGSGPLIITPNIPGKYRWKGTDVLEFFPEQPFKLATEFKLSIPKGTASTVSKEQLSEEYTWTFRTPVPHVIEVSPGSKSGANNVSLNCTIYF